MDVDPDPHKKQKAEALLDCVARLVKAESALSSHSRAIPHGRDFHFYNNFDEFRSPVRGIAGKARPLLSRIGSSSVVSRTECPPELPEDLDDALDWVVNLNDDLVEKFGTMIDEFRRSREEMEAGAGRGVGRGMGLEEGFQVVGGKNKKKRNGADSNGEGVRSGEGSSNLGARIATRDKIHFHNPNIPRPQDEYHILVNNSNVPFDHVWLEKSEDGSRYMHPLEKLSANDFINKDIIQGEPDKPLPLSCTPFKLVEGLKELKELASKLRDVDEFAIDLEHNRYRSFQGMTCLMQISTRTEDFVVDTLKLRVHIGPHLRGVFKDPSKRKVMHGANSDIAWLQRDFGIYVCNLFDTGQASRVMQLERNSLEYLLHHFCGVTANKEYQNAEWRLRPLPDEMLKYAREDTHYLLYIYDVMRQKLLSLPSDSGNGGVLMEVYQRSRDICMQLYEKELLTDTSYLHLYGLLEADFNSQQLAVASGLYGWRDTVARAEDESTGYILPNKVLLQIARHMPLTAGQLRRLVRSNHPFVERNLGSVVAVIKNAIQNAPAFEDVCEQLKKDLLDMMNGQSCEANDNDSEPNLGGLAISTIPSTGNVGGISTSLAIHSASASLKTNANCPPISREERLTSISTAKLGSFNGLFDTARKAPLDDKNIVSLNTPKTTNVASVPVLKKPSSPFGALLPKRKSNLDVREKSIEQAKAESKLAQIKSSVSLPFHSFSGNDMKPMVVETVKSVSSQHLEPQLCGTNTFGANPLEDVILLENGTCDSPPAVEMSGADDSSKHFMLPENGTSVQSPSEIDDKDEPMSLSELYSSFQKLESRNQTRNTTPALKNRQSEETNPLFEFQPFDYAAAREQINFATEKEECEEGGESSDRRKGRGRGKGLTKQRRIGAQRLGTSQGQTQSADFELPRRRQAFPASGNRSGTFN